MSTTKSAKPNHAVVNLQQHSGLRISNQYSRFNSDSIGSVLIFPNEFRNIESSYPIFFQKNSETGEFYSIALLGLEQGENLFLSAQAPTGWDASYIPLNIQRQPFMIGIQNDNPIVTVDLDSPKIGETDGEQLFNDDGTHSDYFGKVIMQLEQLHQGVEHGKQFTKKLEELGLLESFELSYQLNDGSSHKLLNFYTIHEEKVMKLEAEALGELNSKGYLQPLFMAIASLSRFPALIARKNSTLA